jgi:DNA-binding response OmpR family regulator
MPRRLTRRPSPLPAPIILATADEALSRLLCFALDQLRLRYRRLHSGAEAMEELLTMPTGTRAPVVLLDADLPGVDGHAILERLATVRPDTFLIVVLSSHADESVQLRSLLSGAVDHLAKPFNVRVLMAKVGRWVAMGARRMQGI